VVHDEERFVSIPFIAGQWSLRGPHGGHLDRGGAGFNPLHCGAVVASDPALKGVQSLLSLFQSPSLRGSGRFCKGSGNGTPTPARFNPLHCGAVVASVSGTCWNRTRP